MTIAFYVATVVKENDVHYITIDDYKIISVDTIAAQSDLILKCLCYEEIKAQEIIDYIHNSATGKIKQNSDLTKYYKDLSALNPKISTLVIP